MDTDLFGNAVVHAPSNGKRKDPTPAGYAAKPGTGPKHEMCRTCQHKTIIQFSKKYLKCKLAETTWTHGRKTDILMRSPACKKWEAPPLQDYCQRAKCQRTCHYFANGQCPDQLRKAVLFAAQSKEVA